MLTLEEAAQADLLLVVVDGSDPMACSQVLAVEQTLASLGMQDKDKLYVINKSDKITDETALKNLRNEVGESVVVSAHSGQGTDEMLAIIEDPSTC